MPALAGRRIAEGMSASPEGRGATAVSSAGLGLWADNLLAKGNSYAAERFNLAPDRVWPNAELSPMVVSLLAIVAATVLRENARIDGWRSWLAAGTVGMVAVAGLIGAEVGRQ